MFRRKRDTLARQIDIRTELWDFVDWSILLQRQEKVAGTGMALTLATAVGTQMMGGLGWMNHALSAARILGSDNLRRMIIPGMIVTSKHRQHLPLSSLTLTLLTSSTTAMAATFYVLSQIPNCVPHRLSNKISGQLAQIDYVHANSSRIASSVRKVLRFPADSLRVGLQRAVEQLGSRQEETLKIRTESDVALKYFGNLVRDSARQRSMVENVDLDAHPLGVPGLSGH
jgi:mitofusin